MIECSKKELIDYINTLCELNKMIYTDMSTEEINTYNDYVEYETRNDNLSTPEQSDNKILIKSQLLKLQNMNLLQLKLICHENNLSKSGIKQQVYQRLVDFYNKQEHNESSTD